MEPRRYKNIHVLNIAVNLTQVGFVVALLNHQKEFGLGLCLYIKFFKHLSCFLFFLSLLSVAAIVLYIIVAKQTGYNATGSYHNALFSTTIGTLSSQFLKCNYANIKTNTV